MDANDISLMRNRVSRRVTNLAICIPLWLFSGPSIGAEWFLVRVEKAELYSAVAAHRLETTLAQASDRLMRFWLRTDYLRPRDFKYPSRPRNGNIVATEAILWEKTRYTVNCVTQQLSADEGTYMLAREQIEFQSTKPHSLPVTPDTISEVLFRIACDSGRPRAFPEVRAIAYTIEKVLVPDSSKQKQLREEKTVPQFLI